MAQLLLIKTGSLSSKDNRQVGDVVGVFPDDHVFSEHELKIFDVVSVEQTKTVLEMAWPEVHIAHKSKTTEWTLDEPEMVGVWRDKDDYKQIKMPPRFATRLESGQLVENYSRYVENHTVLISTKKEESK